MKRQRVQLDLDYVRKLPPYAARLLLQDSRWQPRCVCGLYGLPWADVFVVSDDRQAVGLPVRMAHFGADARRPCQPLSETLL